jgi:D-erythronate 2-dehydrogenase
MAGETRVVVTGAAGFIGRQCCAALRPTAAGQGGVAADLVTTDCAGWRPQRTAGSGSPRQAHHEGDIADPALIESLFERPVHRVFHLAGIVSGRAEADFALGKRVNLDATIALLERCRQQVEQGGPVVRFVYSSSIAVFGTPLPRRIDDSTQPLPTLSYGTHKRAIELLIDDYSRRGFIDGRALRLSGVLLRPPLANGALSAFNSDVIREPLAGRAFVCPVGPDATIWLTSLRSTVRNLLRLADIDAGALGAQRCITAPALAARVGDIVQALGRIDAAAPARVSYEPQPRLEAQFGRWPIDCSFERANALGLHVDASLDALLHTIREPA